MAIQKILVGFFLLIFSFQLAPVQEVGFFLYNNQNTEEIPHGQDESGMKYPDDSFKQLIQFFSDQGNNLQYTASLLKGKAVNDSIQTRSSDDIQTPPPNLIA
ncbi:MAG: hypothetical protein ACRC2O_01475 [Chitinophagaceae bacterium]